MISEAIIIPIISHRWSTAQSGFLILFGINIREFQLLNHLPNSWLSSQLIGLSQKNYVDKTFFLLNISVDVIARHPKHHSLQYFAYTLHIILYLLTLLLLPYNKVCYIVRCLIWMYINKIPDGRILVYRAAFESTNT